MRILIIDNCTKNLDSIFTLLDKAYPNASCEVTNYYNLHDNYDTNNLDLIILSGGKPKRYETLNEDERQIYINYEKELILNCKVPLIGICYGFKLICETFNANIDYEPSIIKGLVNITLVNKFANQMGIKKAQVHMQHHFITTQVGQSLEVLANSKYGIEIVKHVSRDIYGFQFHPEIDPNAQDGDEIVQNVLKSIDITQNS
jgi:GMP synthase-like glutamine amidotransferase